MQHVDRHILELRREALAAAVVGDVELLDTEGLVLRGEVRERLRRVRAAVGRDDRPAFRRVLLGELQPDAGIGARDHHGLGARQARQPHHREPEQHRLCTNHG